MSWSYKTSWSNRIRRCAGISGAMCFLLASLLAFAQDSDTPALNLFSLPPPPGHDSTNDTQDFLIQSNSPVQIPATNSAEVEAEAFLKKCHDDLAKAQNLVNTRQFAFAEPALIALLAEKVPDEVRRPAMYELATVVEEENDLPRAQAILTQYLDRWPGDARTPEILLRQGQLFRQMGLDSLALGKFYSVMTVSLSLKDDQFDYYQSLVLQAQIEIAETHYLMGQFSEAADFYARLLKHTDTALNRPLAQFRLVRSLAVCGRAAEAAGAAQDFLARYPDDPQEPEVRYYLAQALKASGQNEESLRQVLFFLQEEKAQSTNQPEVWAYWQQRVGNEIANELYKEGDYVKALDVYLSLEKMDDSPAWRIPVDYQIGITYEHLMQPKKAIDTYNEILAREVDLGTNETPGLKAVFDMARWRINFVGWQEKAEDTTHSLALATTNSAATPPTEVTTK